MAKGDLTTTQGRVLGGSSSWYASNGKTLARRHDLATCGNCEGAFPIYGTADTWLDEGLPTVKHLDLVLCPCGQNRVLSGNREFLFTGHGARNNSDATTTSLASSSSIVSVFEQQVVLRSPLDGRPLSGVRYRARGASGQVFAGVTNSMGLTERIKTNAAETLQFEVAERWTL